MGKSDKPDIAYWFADHVQYIDAFIDALGLTNITLVIHDWGSAIGFHYASRHRENIRGIAFMEAIVHPARWDELNLMERMLVRRLRHPVKGARMLIKRNFFVERLLPMLVVRKLTDTEMDAYRAPFVDPPSRTPIAQWPREIPFDGEPADNHEMVGEYWRRLRGSDIPKLLLWARPGALIKPSVAEALEQALPNLESVYLGEGKH